MSCGRRLALDRPRRYVRLHVRRTDLPTGTVTFLLTDIEGSTKLLHALGSEAYAEALAEHRRRLREVFARHGGVEVDTQGDAFFYAFAEAKDAAAAAADAQETLSSGPIRVRMGLHTGTPHLTEEGYVGADVHKGARIAAAGHGGQVLLSRETHELIEEGVTDLGEHRVKDFAQPVWIFQLGSERFPPLRTISNTNLPRPVSSFVGREREVAEVAAFLLEARLVTLSGPGGSGKTRLAIKAASDLVREFRNGVFWVDLAVLRDPGLVTGAIAQTLGAKEGLAEHVGDREMLLLLDNFEQVVEAAPHLSDLLEACPNLKVLVTSRELLRVRGEVEFAVPPLAAPEAVELFCARAGLEPDETIAELCRRLDNLPLAVELAAARASVLSPAQILERLSKALDLLKGGRDAEARQRTLRATIEWSHELLDKGERGLFARLAVFVGGCTLEAAEEVAHADLDVLQSLVDKSLLRHTQDRFWMLETIREYALDRLRTSGVWDDLRSRHLAWFVSFLERSEPELAGPRQTQWVQRMEHEFGNVRAAFAWSLATGDIEPALRLVGTRRFWQVLQGHQGEGIEWVDEALSRANTADPTLRARALAQAGDFRRVRGDLDGARTFLEGAISIQRELLDPTGLGQTLYVLGRLESGVGSNERAYAATEESVAIARATGNRQALGEYLAQLGEITYERGVPAQARPLLEEALLLARETGDAHSVADALRVLAMIDRDDGKFEEARSRLAEALALQRDLADSTCTAVSLSVIGDIALRERDWNQASALFAESLMLHRSLGPHSYRMVDSLWGLAAASAEQRQVVRAARLLGAEEALRREVGAPLRLTGPERHDAVRQALRQLMEEAALAAAWGEGVAMNREAVLAYALGDHAPGAAREASGHRW
jgi:predicted ATPase/class 3 adenylate cyclase